MSRLFPLALLVGLVPIPAYARLDPESNKPYEIRIVLQVGANRVFTPFFQERLQRGLHDSLQATLGRPLGNVEVIDAAALVATEAKNGNAKPPLAWQRTRDLYQQVRTRGLQDALDEWKELSETKTHFVVIDFADGLYSIHARQFDGLTGLASPLVREATTNDPEFVLRLALYLIEQDFGVVGTFAPPSAKEGEVRVVFKGGGLGSALARWVKKGDVFAVAQIGRTATSRHSKRMDETLLKALEEPKNGACHCQVLHRYADPLPTDANVLGYRCLKLGTTSAPLKLHLTDRRGNDLGGLRVEVWPDGFERGSKSGTATDGDGCTGNKLGAFQNVAFVRVLSGMTVLAQFPVEILDERVVVRRVDPRPEQERLGRFLSERTYLVGRMTDSLLGVNGLIEELNQVGGNSKTRDAALKKAKAGLRALQAEQSGYQEQIVKLRAVLPPSEIAPADEGLKRLEQKDGEFQKYIEQLEAVIQAEGNPLRATLLDMQRHAKYLESEAKFDEAVDLYAKMQSLAGNQPGFQKLAADLDRLKREWAPKSEEHRLARAFIYTTWAGLTSAADLKEKVEAAKKALAVCKAAGDKRTPLKLLSANAAHLTALTKQAEKAIASTNPDEREAAKDIPAVVDALKKMTEEATAFVRPIKSGEK